MTIIIFACLMKFKIWFIFVEAKKAIQYQETSRDRFSDFRQEAEENKDNPNLLSISSLSIK